ncbi:Exoribonuclease phosphorolytic domain 1 [Macrophomina phaseolina MS6]|uniref:Exoribonuclease phosphorolytic domain 1 n=2 Tax=Macrophomina phaseolina TaxID=35725 RepID=K2RKK5_MACPH|nr:Exoribonuclease phosphorolytic domain 1 [Macrophomina phaseolina MS6]KAH7043204.1 exoribonuclease [Macrophomina phaseolina]
MTDRRRTNAPAGGTYAPVFASFLPNYEGPAPTRPSRTRSPDELRKMFLKTGLTPSASGSAYLELTPGDSTPRARRTTLAHATGHLKLSCVVHGPKPLPRSSPFTPYLNLTTTLKFAPFATRTRRGYVRDAAERDLGQHLEAALRGIVIGERWPKSGVDIIITVLEGEEDGWVGDELGLQGGAGKGSVGMGWGLMNVLAGCITVASAAIVDAGIDCVDMVAGGVAALVKEGEGEQLVLDPSPPEHKDLVAACVVGYLPGRDEITELWMKGDAGDRAEDLVERSVQAALASRLVLEEAVKESAALKYPQFAGKPEKGEGGDVEMVG